MSEPERGKDSSVPSVSGRGADRTLWVVAVLAFWVSAGATAAVMVVTGRLDLILVSITLGMMILGVWFKARYQLRLRQDRARASGGESG